MRTVKTAKYYLGNVFYHNLFVLNHPQRDSTRRFTVQTIIQVF